jgi:hypothetical protein
MCSEEARCTSFNSCPTQHEKGHLELKEAVKESKKRVREQKEEEKKKMKEKESMKKKKAWTLLKMPEVLKTREWFDDVICEKIQFLTSKPQWMVQPVPSIAAEASHCVMVDYCALEGKQEAMKEVRRELKKDPVKLKAWLDAHPMLILTVGPLDGHQPALCLRT